MHPIEIPYTPLMVNLIPVSTGMVPSDGDATLALFPSGLVTDTETLDALLFPVTVMRREENDSMVVNVYAVALAYVDVPPVTVPFFNWTGPTLSAPRRGR